MLALLTLPGLMTTMTTLVALLLLKLDFRSEIKNFQKPNDRQMADAIMCRGLSLVRAVRQSVRTRNVHQSNHHFSSPAVLIQSHASQTRKR